MDNPSGPAYYRRYARDYDASAQRTMALRRRTIARLGLRPGDVVLDTGCGTGLSFPLLLDAVGTSGRVIGVESSADMLVLARERAAAAGWNNVTLLEFAAEAVVLPCVVDALLFNYTHDVIRSPAALDNLFRQAPAGARVAVAGIKHPPRWLDPFRLYRRFKSRGCYSNTEGLDAPWDRLQALVPDLRVESTLWGTGFMAWGRYQGVSPE
ncbi:MAG: class I SAM-dependent methyltransferase [Betaproteobacteria bacterium]